MADVKAGAAIGGSVGAAVGSVVPGIGTAIGGAVGAAVGSVAAGIANLRQKAKETEGDLLSSTGAFTVEIGPAWGQVLGLEVAEALASGEVPADGGLAQLRAAQEQGRPVRWTQAGFAAYEAAVRVAS